MKALVAAGALAALVMTTPALAQTNNSGDEAFALAPPTGPIYSDGSIAASHPHDVVVDGAIVGRDPDPNIRFQLFREGQSWNAGDGGGGE
jgi:hypothetical protein